MSGDDELARAKRLETVQELQEGDLAGRRQRRLGLIEQVEAGSREPAPQVAEDALPVRERVQDVASIVFELTGIAACEIVDKVGKLAEGLGTKERSRHAAVRPSHGDELV